MKTTAIRGNVVADYEVWEGATLLLRGGTLVGVYRDGSAAPTADEVYEFLDGYLTPGFVDPQVNGSFGVDVATAPQRLSTLSRRLVETGTTAYLPTVITSKREYYPELLPRLATAMNDSPEEPSGGATPLGVHLEGPFIDSGKRGAHPKACVAPPDEELLLKLLELAPLRMLTLAPELEGAAALTRTAVNRGVTVSAGHTGADFEAAYRALDTGVWGVTHLFNAMNPLHHREPGVPGAAFAHPRAVCGLIADGRHVHPEVVNLAFRMLGPDRLYLTTDAISAAGMGPGEYSLAGQPVYLEGGVPRLKTGEIAGSILTMAEALKNVLAFTGCTITEAVRMVSTTPARLVGADRKGRLAPGYDADLVFLSPGLGVEAVWVGGRRVR